MLGTQQDQLQIAVDILILTVREGRLALLLRKRKAAPYAGCWALPGRIIGRDESAEETAQKLMAELLPIRDAFFEQLYTFTDVGRDPRGRVISIAYLAIVPWTRLSAVMAAGQTALQDFDIALCGGLCLRDAQGAQLTDGEMAFDHARIIETGVLRLRGKLDYTEIGFRFLGDLALFSLSELQTVFEAILDRPVDSSNFRRTILNRYEETGRIKATDRMEKQRRGRPAALYRMTE